MLYFTWRGLYKQVIISLTLLNFIFTSELAIFTNFLSFSSKIHNTVHLQREKLLSTSLSIYHFFKAQAIWKYKGSRPNYKQKDCISSL